jgi:pimeloyl-ACP methyl ester carboxylesterase
MKPFFFGAPAKPLFGVANDPADAQRARGAVLLCYPFGREYQRSHRAMRELSHHLSQNGHHTLRFDYFGCGDSSGASEDGEAEQWLEDIGHGVEELRESSGFRRVSLVGLRLGATLAALAASRDPDIDRLVLWDPVVNGAEYLDELAGSNQEFMQDRERPRGWVAADPPDELLGTPVTSAMRASIARADLMTLTRSPARSVRIIATDPSPALDRLREHIASLGAAADLQHIASSARWLKRDQEDRALVPQEIIQHIAAWLGETR